MAPAVMSCPICHRTNGVSHSVDEMCEDCAKDWALNGGQDAIDSAVWAAQRAWKFASAEIEAAQGQGRRVVGYQPGDPGPSRWVPRRRR